MLVRRGYALRAQPVDTTFERRSPAVVNASKGTTVWGTRVGSDAPRASMASIQQLKLWAPVLRAKRVGSARVDHHMNLVRWADMEMCLARKPWRKVVQENARAAKTPPLQGRRR
jgi:hypothetical protein